MPRTVPAARCVGQPGPRRDVDLVAFWRVLKEVGLNGLGDVVVPEGLFEKESVVHHCQTVVALWVDQKSLVEG